MERYLKFSNYLKKLYGSKVYKIPVNVAGTCPNRDKITGEGGCSFCNLKTISFDMQNQNMDIVNQVKKNIDYIGKKYKANKFIIYFQNYTATYTDIIKLDKNIRKAIQDDVVEVCLSTRPDCVSDDCIQMLLKIKKEYNINITVELGLQSINNSTLYKINRGHTVEDFVDCVKRLKNNNIIVGTHLILNLPWDDDDTSIKTAKLLNDLNIDRVKLHSLFIAKETLMEKQYLNNEFTLISAKEYLNRVILFIRYLNPQITIERFFSRATKEETVFINWNRSWRYLHNKLMDLLEELNVKQGDLYVSN